MSLVASLPWYTTDDAAQERAWLGPRDGPSPRVNPIHAELASAAARARTGRVQGALDLAFSCLDGALRKGSFERVGDALRAFDVEGADLDLVVTVLMTTKPARDQLPERMSAVDRLRARLEAEMPERAEAIMRFI